ncbi:MAG: hypothetical protein CML05_03140 [Pseudozobellia sp.]|nr:hypothetical protein [Pseudozobellia sp.]
MEFSNHFLESVKFEFNRYKVLGDACLKQLSYHEMNWKASESDNSVPIIVKHMNGNMLSRWTNFLIEDGEKNWRQREQEFENSYQSKGEIITAWEEGWECLFDALDTIHSNNFGTQVKIRNENHSITEAVHRQLAHYASHVGQIVLLAKMIKGPQWKSLSIPKGKSEAFNRKMFGS